MVDIVLHLGLGKCGSSALQSSLSMQPIQSINTDNYKKIKYVSIDRFGHLYAGKQLYEKALFSPAGYSASCSAGQMKSFSDSTFDSIKAKLQVLSNHGENLIIMSWEGWSTQAGIFEQYDLLEKFGVQANLICYVRNPVEWINSAWWQWGAWSGENIDSYIEWAIEKRITNWPIYIDQWKQLKRVKSVTVRVLPKDIVSDFYEFVGVDTILNHENRNNLSLPGEILRFYQKHRELRPSEHDSSLDFILSNVLELDDTFERTPWVLNQIHIDKILKKSKASTLRLMELLDEKSREVCHQDNRWWDKNAFSAKSISTAQYNEAYLSFEQIDKTLFLALKSIKKLYQQNLQLKEKISNLRNSNS